MGSRVQVEEETNLDVLDAEEDGDGEGEDDKELGDVDHEVHADLGAPVTH